MITSTPAAKSSSAIPGVMPSPPAAFSPLTTTKVGLQLLAQGGEETEQRPAAEPADDVADEQDAWRHDMVPCDPVRAMAPPNVPAPVVIPRWVQLVTLPVLLVGLFIVARAAGVVLLVFIVAGVIALILNPIVTIVQRGRLPRGLAVAVVYLGFFVSLVLLGYLLSEPIADQVRAFQRDVPAFIDDANESLADLQETLDDAGHRHRDPAPGRDRAGHAAGPGPRGLR